MTKLISTQEVAKHNTLNDLWVVVEGQVYDMTGFVREHPGGIANILREAGRDATAVYSEVHSSSLIKATLPPEKQLGKLDVSTIDPTWAKPPVTEVARVQGDITTKPALSTLISAHDFEEVASRTLAKKTWAFYWSAATDLHTKCRNSSAYSEIGLRPRVLRNVATVSTQTDMLGQNLSLPIFCSPTSMVKLAHPDGEKEMARGCKSAGIPHCISTAASFPLAEIVDAVGGGGFGGDEKKKMPFFFQLYVDKQRHKSEKLLKDAESVGVKAIFVTVDSPVAGKREADERVKADESISTPMSGMKAKNDSRGGALGRIMAGFIDATLSWADIPWLRSVTSLPIVLKGIQTAADAELAVQAGVDGILLSNHGGRSLDTSPAPILVLLELQKCCPYVFNHLEVFVDGGITRGTDVFKALCLGAKAVGIGRGLLFALNYGAEGVEKYLDIMKDELQTTMQMCGVTDLSQVHPGLLNTLAVDHLIPTGEDHPYAKWRPGSKL